MLLKRRLLLHPGGSAIAGDIGEMENHHVEKRMEV